MCVCVCVCKLAHAEASITLKSMPDLFLSADGPWYTVFTVNPCSERIFLLFLYVFQQYRLKSSDSGENIRSHIKKFCFKLWSYALTS